MIDDEAQEKRDVVVVLSHPRATSKGAGATASSPDSRDLGAQKPRGSNDTSAFIPPVIDTLSARGSLPFFI